MNDWAIDYYIVQLAYEDRLREAKQARQLFPSPRTGKLLSTLMLALWGLIGFFDF